MEQTRIRWLYIGLYGTTLSTLMLEIMNSRLLSVVTWYHISFFAVSLAMLGMAGGAVTVFAAGRMFQGRNAPLALARASLLFAVSIPLLHILSLQLRVPPVLGASWDSFWRISLMTVVITIPFYLSGMVVTVALTRVGGSIGRLYSTDLLGAALGCLLVIPLLNTSHITTTACATGFISALGAVSYYRFAGRGWSLWLAALVAVTVAMFAVSIAFPGIFGTVATKGFATPPESIQLSRWNNHSHIKVLKAREDDVYLWGAGKGSEGVKATSALMVIDGGAGTVLTKWDGDPHSLGWIEYDVTYLPYFLRGRGDSAVIGVGGGRDILSALHAGSRSVTGIELNRIFLDLLEKTHREFTRIADRPDVTLVHDEARSYLGRAGRKFDLLQMSLIDTWAATGAGAFALSENGLYTREAWNVFLDSIKPGGVFSVSRWFSPSNVSETNRLLSLGVAALLDHGVTDPSKHILLVARQKVATLMLSLRPFTVEDYATIKKIAEKYEFKPLVAPWVGALPRMQAIVNSASIEDLMAATQDSTFDYSPPTDERPYFFNVLKPSISALRGSVSGAGAEGVIGGNIRATITLMLLMTTAVVLVGLIIFGPLLFTGRPGMRTGSFCAALLYFALIGFGFMLIQFAFLQRFSIYLGHPTYSLSVILFSMILFTGLGSFISDRINILQTRIHYAIPAAIAAFVFMLMPVVPDVTAGTMVWALPGRALLVVVFMAPLSILLGFCFPVGMRLVTNISSDSGAWMWGVNGAFSVLGSIFALCVSMWLGINTNLELAAVCYLLMLIPMILLTRAAAAATD